MPYRSCRAAGRVQIGASDPSLVGKTQIRVPGWDKYIDNSEEMLVCHKNRWVLCAPVDGHEAKPGAAHHVFGRGEKGTIAGVPGNIYCWNSEDHHASNWPYVLVTDPTVRACDNAQMSPWCCASMLPLGSGRLRFLACSPRGMFPWVRSHAPRNPRAVPARSVAALKPD